MHLRGKVYTLQKEELKLLTDFPAVYNQYMEILTLLKKYVAIFPLTYYVYSFEGRCQCKSAAAQLLMLRKNKKNYLLFRTDFVLSIPLKFLKKKYHPKYCSKNLSPLLVSDYNENIC